MSSMVTSVEQALMDAGFLASVKRPGVVYGGFQAVLEDSGDVRVTHAVGEYTGSPVEDGEHRRRLVGSAVSRMERELSRKGWLVTMFEPVEGDGFWLLVRPAV